MKKIFSLLAMIVFIYANDSQALSMQFINTMPQIITKNTVSQFDIFGNGIGTTVFVIILNNDAGNDTLHNLQLRYTVDFHPKNGGTQKKIYEGISNRFTMASPENVPPITSKQFLIKNNPAVKISLRTTLHELSNTDPLKKQFLDTQRIPDGKIVYSMALEGAAISNPVQTSEHIIINTSTVDLVTPGSAPEDFTIDIFNQHPVFTWTSDIPPYIYGPDDVFEIRIYQAKAGESASEALSRKPSLKAGVKSWQFQYPDNKHKLEVGVYYYWEVIGFIRSTSVSEIKSSPYKFRMAKPANTKVQQVIAILKQYPDEYTNEILDLIEEYDSDVILKIDGRNSSVNELGALVQKYIKGTHEVLSTNIE